MSALGVAFLALLACLAAIVLLNWLAQHAARRWSTVLASPEDRNNQLNRKLREELVPLEYRASWYDLASADEQYAMWEEFYHGGNEFECYTHFRHRPSTGKYVGVTSAGYRLCKNPGPWPPSPKSFNVFFFGGSTAFGVGPYWATIASYFQEIANQSGAFDRPVHVYNFGRSGYQSTQETVLFGRLLAEGAKCNMVIFFDGLNDFCFFDGKPSQWHALDHYFNESNRNYREMMAGYGITTPWNKLADFMTSLPLVRIAAALASRYQAPVVQAEVSEDSLAPDRIEDESILSCVVRRYVENMRQVKALAQADGIVPVFVWQPSPIYRYDKRLHLFMPKRFGPHINSTVGYPMVMEAMKEKPLGSSFIWAADMQIGATECLYVDSFHYTAPMCRRIAQFIFQEIQDRDLIAK